MNLSVINIKRNELVSLSSQKERINPQPRSEQKEYIVFANHRRQDADVERTGKYLQRVRNNDVFFSCAWLEDIIRAR